MSDVLDEVLIVEDVRIIRDMLRQSLENVGYHVFEATEGQAARRTLRQSPCSMVVVLDADLPGASAEAILSDAVSDPRLARHAFVYMTAARPDQESPMLQQALSALAIPVLRTPFSVEMLVETVGKAAKRPVSGAISGSSTHR